MTEFYDSARSGLIPSGAAACVYYDGRYAITPAQARRFSRVRWITIAGGAAAAAHTGAIDYENGNLAYEGSQLADWATARKAMNCRARVYCSRSDLERAHPLVGHMGNVVWWIATLDGDQRSEADMLANIAAETGIHLAPGTLWAQQWNGGVDAPFDESVLFGTW